MIDVFVITNGRESFDFCMESIKNQSVKLPVSVVRDYDWLDAVNYCKYNSKCSFFMRVDDDMLLDKKFFEFCCYTVEGFLDRKTSSRPILVSARLLELHRNKIIRGIKLYNTKLSKKVLFRVDVNGKIDRLFKQDAVNAGYYIHALPCVVGIHAANSFEWQVQYIQQRREQLTNHIINRFIEEDRYYKEHGLHQQLQSLDALYELNKSIGGPFWDFCNDTTIK